ncbi:hypothetical protein [Nocardiopsis synnemataformans]|uniref:hypothetical protein n=1 Tax=Nocardiopsis synnemataformans TaxID=61305 RepID=UPI003EBD3738
MSTHTVIADVAQAASNYLTTAQQMDICAPGSVRQALEARQRWVDARLAAAPKDDPVLDAPCHWPPAVGDLLATPDGQLWVAEGPDLVQHGETNEQCTVDQMRRRGGVVLYHGRDRYSLVEEALSACFPLGSRVSHPSIPGAVGVVTVPPSWDAISDGGGLPWIASRYTEGIVYIDGFRRSGWWVGSFLRPASEA